jgi:hypothetical protein
LYSQRIELFGKRHGVAAFKIGLASADHVQEFNAGQDVPGGLKGLKSEHRFGDALDRTMVLLHNIICGSSDLTCRTTTEIPSSSLICSMSALLAPLLSIVTFSVTELSRMAWSKKRIAAALSRLAVSRKSTFCPSSQRPDRDISGRLSPWYVSSMRQLLPTGRLCLRNVFSRKGRN